MSTLKADTIQSTSGGVATLTSQVAPKAFINFNGDDTTTIRDSFNCGAVTDGGTGDQTVNYTNNFANAGYSPQSNCQSGDASNPASCVVNTQSTVTTSSTKLFVKQNTGTGASSFDSEHMSLTSTGDLA
tara:strand:- start:333 stop:719 length:387 start_codon:yes stop_codon:yes gene_type:complete